MSLDILLESPTGVRVFETNITHTLNRMAQHVEIYEVLWHAPSAGITTAHQLIRPLWRAVQLLQRDPKRCRQLNAPNGWGTYDTFLPWVKQLLKACEEHPTASVITVT